MPINKETIDLFSYIDQLIVTEGDHQKDGIYLEFNNINEKTWDELCAKVIRYDDYDISCIYNHSNKNILAELIAEFMEDKSSASNFVQGIEYVTRKYYKPRAQQLINERLQYLEMEGTDK